MSSEIVLQCCKYLAANGYKIAFVESATAGRMCFEFSLAPDSGDIVRGGISCYEVYVKEKILKVPPKLIEKHTPESAEVTKSLAEHASQLFKADITIAVTGLTTFGGSETSQKPVGTMFIHIIMPSGFIAHREIFTGSAEEIVLQTIDKAASLITEQLKR